MVIISYKDKERPHTYTLVNKRKEDTRRETRRGCLVGHHVRDQDLFLSFYLKEKENIARRGFAEDAAIRFRVSLCK